MGDGTKKQFILAFVLLKLDLLLFGQANAAFCMNAVFPA
jgi:hypothetical protein